MKLFAETCEALSKESSTLKKVDLIAQTLQKLPDDNELNLFCLYLTGTVYPSTVQKTINIGGAWIREATIKVLGLQKEKWEEAYKKIHETGETVEYMLESFPKVNVSDLVEEQKPENQSDDNSHSIQSASNQTPVTLSDFQNYIESLNQTSGSLAKVQIIAELFEKLSPIEAKYAAKLLTQYLRIGSQEATVESGIAQAFEIDKKEVQRMNFYLGDIGEVALRCKNKNFENISFRLFHPIRAMLASAEVDIKEIFRRMGDQVWVEYKYDGIRSHIHAQEDKVEIYTRDLKRVTSQFPEVVENIQKLLSLQSSNNSLLTSFLLDGEIVPFKDNKIGPFADLQKRLGRKEKIEEASQNNPTTFIAYDFLYLNGEILFEKTLKERRTMMQDLFKDQIHYSTQKIVSTPAEFTSFFVQSKKEGREGTMVKNPESTYESGKRGIHWLKYKQTLDPLDVVVLEAHYGTGKNGKYLSTYKFGVWDEKRENLIPVGSVYSGTTEKQLEEFTQLFPTISTEQLPSGFKVQPKVILEVGFENVQKSERHGSGYAVRFPRILRIRTGDKPLEEINSIEDVARTWKKLNEL